ncbi:YbaB/EbfC family nucleoid-associated protein [Streptosporangium sp. KLBMP 9127]|nr:YbaB/EbfC family nucleoid-associated protein [Streptosporangium sp. KLBMP 9127]
MYGSRMEPGDIRDEDLERSADQAAEMLAWIETAKDEVDEIVGVGAGESGHVKATAAADGKVLAVTFEPRALRLDSRTLAAEVLSAVQEAQGDAERQTHELMRVALPGFDPVETQAQLDRVLRAPLDG